MSKSKTSSRLTLSIITIVILALSLCVTSYAIYISSVAVRDNHFKTGVVSIDLNGGKPIIEEDEFLLEPGMTIEKDFYIKNQSSWAVYYRLYFDNVSGNLSDVLKITILEGDNVLYEGTASTLSKDLVLASDDILLVDQKRTLTVRFYYPPSSGNDTQDQYLKFDFCADAVQEKNNPNKEFE